MKRAEGPSFRLMLATLAAVLTIMAVGLRKLNTTGVVSLTLVMPVVFFVTMFWSIRWSVRRIDRIYAIHYLPAHFICPACGHSLKGLTPESDGCTVCPECGAAWRIPVV